VILVLGASSYIGRHYLKAEGANAIGTHMNNPVPGTVFYDATCMRLSDILPKDLKVSHAVIFYAVTEIDPCKAAPERSYEINIRSTKSIIDDLVQNNIKPVFISSEYVFDGIKGNYTEDDKASPTTVYGAQKLEIEKYLAQYCQDYAILRLAKVLGTDPEDGTILSNWLKQIRKSEEIYCADDQIFSPIHVDDVVAITSALVNLNASDIFHVSNVESCSRWGMLKTLLDSLEVDARVVKCRLGDLDFLDNRPLDLSMNPKKVIETTGITPRTVRSCCEEFSGKLIVNGTERK